MLARLSPVLLLTAWIVVTPVAFADPAIHFDLPATARATDVTPRERSGHELLVSIELELSLIADSLQSPHADQLVVQVSPLGGGAEIADYSPRTELSSSVAGDIEVSKSQEVVDNLGVSIDAAYGHLVRGKVGADRGEKETASTKYNRVAPMHIVAASGTTHRGRGVYFKLRADDRQVLEGDKQFTVVLRVPMTWRGELLEVRVVAESMARGLSSSLSSFAGMAPKSHQVGAGRFLVATHLDQDHETAATAQQLAETELELRRRATQAIRQESPSINRRLPSHVSFRLDMTSTDPTLRRDRAIQTVEQVLFGSIDPYVDPTIQKLPVDVRVAILDYLEARDHYLSRVQAPATLVNTRNAATP